MRAETLLGAGRSRAEALVRRTPLSSGLLGGAFRAGQRLRRAQAVELPGWDRDLLGAPLQLAELDAPGDGAASPADGGVVRDVVGPQRVTVLTPDLDAGGMDVFAHDLALSLRDAGSEVTVVHLIDPERPARGDRLARSLLERGVLVDTVGLADLGAWCRRHSPGVVSSHGASAATLGVLDQAGIPVVETWHGPFGMLRGEEESARERLRLARAHVAVSEALRARLLSLAPDPGSLQVVTVPNGATPIGSSGPTRATSRGLLGVGDDTLLVSLARFSLQKNVYAMVAAFVEAAEQRPDLRLVVAGRVDDPAYTRRILRLRDRSRVGDRIHLRDLSRRSDVLLRAADAFVLPSYFEGWSLAATEAAMEGLPLVLSDVPGSRELLGLDPSAPTGRSAAGHLVAAPAGPVGDLDWPSMAAVRYERQPGHDELVAALVDVSTSREVWRAGRSARAVAARDLWSWQECVRGHAALLADLERPGAGRAVSVQSIES